MQPTRVAAGCGIVAPVAFVGGWFVNGLRTEGYDPTTQAISQLARDGATTQPSMTAALVVFGLLLPLWAPTLGRALKAPAIVAPVVVAGLATLAVAALPLTREPGGTRDTLHAVAAGIGYVAMAATPLVAARSIEHRAAAAACLAVGVVSALCLAGTVVSDASGALQRLGLGVVDAWHVVVAGLVLARRLRP